jgi:hypothetical protein
MSIKQVLPLLFMALLLLGCKAESASTTVATRQAETSGKADMSSIAAEKLVELGYTNVWNLSGGMAAWEQAGFPLEGK